MLLLWLVDSRQQTEMCTREEGWHTSQLDTLGLCSGSEKQENQLAERLLFVGWHVCFDQLSSCLYKRCVRVCQGFSQRSLLIRVLLH